MARDFGQIQHRIWGDPDWRALDADAQLLYLLLVSQPTLNHAGILPVQLRRWSGCVASWDVPTVAAAVESLAAARFIVVDEDTEEILVRTFLRNNGGYRIPGLLTAALRSAEAAQSPAIRSALHAELGLLEPLEGKTAVKGTAAIAATRAVLEPIPDGSPDPIPDGSVFNPSRNPSPMGHFAAESPIPEPIPEPPLTVTGPVTGVSHVGIWEGGAPARSGTTAPAPGSDDHPPRCIRHNELPLWDEPPCGACKRLRENWEMTRATEAAHERAERDKPKPMCPTHPGQVAAFCGPCRSELLAAHQETA